MKLLSPLVCVAAVLPAAMAAPGIASSVFGGVPTMATPGVASSVFGGVPTMVTGAPTGVPTGAPTNGSKGVSGSGYSPSSQTNVLIYWGMFLPPETSTEAPWQVKLTAWGLKIGALTTDPLSTLCESK